MLLEIELVEHDRDSCLAKQLAKPAHGPVVFRAFVPVADEDLIAHRERAASCRIVSGCDMRMAEKKRKVKVI